MSMITKLLRCWMLCVALISGTTLADATANDRTASMLYLVDGDYIAGTLRASDTQNVLHWQADGAVQPFEFKAGAVRSAYFAPPKQRPTPVGAYCIELSDGDVVFGDLAAISNDHVEINSTRFGHLRIARAEVHRLTPAAAALFEYRGPNGLSEWRSQNVSQWREEAGRLITEQHGAEIKKTIAFPEQAHIEFELSWTKSPQFALVFATGDSADQMKRGYRLEVWGKKLVLVRELDNSADVAFVGELESNTAHVTLEALYNGPTGEFSVRSLDGRELANIVLPNGNEGPLRCVALKNLGLDVCLEQLSISHWSGHLPPRVDTDKPRVHKADGSIVYGDVVGYRADTKQFVVRSEKTEVRIDSAQIACIVLNPSKKNVATSFRVGLNDGSRFSGELTKVAGEELYLQRRGIDQPLICRIDSVRSLVSLKHDTHSPPYAMERTGRWEAKGILSHGSLVAAPTATDSQATCLAWKPLWSTTASALRSNVSGRIIYRDPPPAPKPEDEERAARRAQPRPAPGFWGAIARAFSSQPVVRRRVVANGSGTLCLLTGDRIPCEAAQIDEDGIHFTSSVVSSDFVPRRAAKAIEFVPRWTGDALAEAERTRLLTLPRMQKSNPPTHLVVSTTGDFLRCRVLSMNAESLVVETRLENKKIPRDHVACIIWLHDFDEPKPTSLPKGPPPIGLPIQAVQSDGIRLTFVPHECNGTSISGVSDVLGVCRVRVNSVDEFLLGSAIREAAEAQIYGKWKLHDAIEPEFARDTPGGGSADNPGAGSMLIGKPAPDFTLDLLDGGHFKLSEKKGKVVILDFWASWCGPCMQAMPITEKVAEEFKNRGVKLVAVNMQEDKASVSGALDRLKINPAVALDIDGAAAEHYQVSAIPQIVVIDSESKVADLLIGIGPSFEDQLRTAVQKALAPKKDK
ncbi:MAG TPA: TlpA disulfide reductase family protein [Lacipirellulaceae bacterium]|nr:TlpA disulfide reductase family protein [Lacipirellulaceae bacterium]